jgi:putative membrane protein
VTLSAATTPRRTHPSSVWVSVLRSIPALLGVLVLLAVQTGGDLPGAAGDGLPRLLAVGAGLLVVGLVLSSLGSYLSWSRRVFWFDEAGDLRVDSGVLTRQQRRLALSRLQSVDVHQPLLARIVGMAEVRVEVAGAGDSRVVLQYLTESDAQALRAQVLARAAGLRPDVGTAPERVLVTVPTRDLVVSLLLSSTTLVGTVATVAIVALAVASEGAVGLVGLLLTGGVPLVAAFNQFVRFFDFTVAESPDGLRLRSGLTSTRTQTVPPGRVHAIEVTEPLLWRRRGWVRVHLTLAGSPGSQGDDDQGTSGVLLPVAPAAVARAVVDRVLPGVGSREFEWQPAPPRARRRAPIQWRELGVAVDADVVATRRGRLVRRLAVVPHARTQSVHLTQGPWERRLGLASLRVDTAPGPVAVVGLRLDAATARAAVDEASAQARRVRAVAGTPRWMSPPSSPPDPAQEPAPDAVPGAAPPPAPLD